MRLFNRDNVTAAEGEKFVDSFISGGDMERKQGEHEKRKLFGLKQISIGGSWGIPKIGKVDLAEIFGTTPFRRLKQGLEGLRRLGYESKHLPLTVPVLAGVVGLWEAIVAFFKQLTRELQRQ